jgi:hypothetical protein
MSDIHGLGLLAAGADPGMDLYRSGVRATLVTATEDGFLNHTVAAVKDDLLFLPKDLTHVSIVVGRCRFMVSRPALEAPVVSALENTYDLLHPTFAANFKLRRFLVGGNHAGFGYYNVTARQAVGTDVECSPLYPAHLHPSFSS